VIIPPDLARAAEILATLLGAAYVILAARRDRLCWIAGILASGLLGALSYQRALPMQAGLQVYYIAISIYGWWNWSRASGGGGLPVGWAPAKWHLLAALIILPLSWLSAEWLALETRAAWPLLDSLTTWASVYATWLVARARIDNWLYWIVIDIVLAYLYYMQDSPIFALQFLAFAGLAVAGFFSWRRRLGAQVMTA
jgi:nicotinamide mononucleotide transporter